MYQSEITERNGKFGLWSYGYGYVWFATRAEAEAALAADPIR